MADPFQPRFVDLVRNFTTTTGTGNFVLGAAVNGYAGFDRALVTGDRFYYSAIGVDKPAESEVGRGTLEANGTISRDPMGGTKTNFTTGTKTLSLIAAAEWFNSIQAGGSAGGGATAAATKAALAGSATQAPALLSERGCEGIFVFDASDLSAKVAADGRQGIHVAAAADPTGASGAWVRKYPGSINVLWFGAKGDGAADDTTAIQAALDYVSGTGGGTLYFPEGAYKIASFLRVGSKTTIRGAGKTASRIVSAAVGGGGTTGWENLKNGSALVSEWPINLGTNRAYISVENLGIENANAANVGAGFAERGGTFVNLSNVRVAGFKYGTVLDQSELADIDLCEFEFQNANGAGLWIVNGPELTPGVQPLFTNRIAVSRTQFNQNAGTDCIVDDGGYEHTFGYGNNYNGGRNAIRAAGAVCAIRGGEFESQSDHVIRLDSLSRSGTAVGGSHVSVDAGLYSAASGKASIFGATSPGYLTVQGEPLFSGGGGTSAISGAAGFAGIRLLGYGNNTGVELCDGAAAFVHFDSSNLGSGDRGDVLVAPSGLTVKSATPADGSFDVAADIGIAGNVLASGSNHQIGPQSGASAITYLILDNNSNNSQILFRSWAGGVASNDASITSTRGVGGGLAYDVVAGGYYRFQVGGANAFYVDLSGLAVTGTIVASNLSGTNSGDQFTTVAQSSLIGRAAGAGTGAAGVLTAGQAKALLAIGAADVSGLAAVATSGSAADLATGTLARPVNAAGAVTSSSASGGIGYAAGAGGAATQTANKSNAVTLNTPTGQITTSGAALGSAAVVSFAVNNSQVAATDTINLNLKSGNATAGAYRYWVEAIAAGSFKIVIENRSGGSLSEALLFNFAVVKAVNS
jgi:hypothetical protein